MRKVTQKMKNGKVGQGLYTNSTMPNQKRKRVRHMPPPENDLNSYVFHINPFAVIAIACIFLSDLPQEYPGWSLTLFIINLFCLLKIEKRD